MPPNAAEGAWDGKHFPGCKKVSARAWQCMPACNTPLEPEERRIRHLFQEDLRIVAVAILHDGVTYSMPPPARHHDVIHAMARRGVPQDGGQEQGFLTNDGRFASRKAAAAIVIRNEQIEKLDHPPNLYSEDLW